ncbi:carbonic anhydrase 2-like [Microplitis mediator]|uniref:carbonic anhydrase 2-like n=1 Tax=Microplitis mediator TaxID=375433 RepID=UPI002553038B|nr:carbonic anhydrase 2-like [Microplitis mediator]
MEGYRTNKSPINIDDKQTKLKKYSPLIMTGHWIKGGEALLVNNSETAIIQLIGDRMASTITGGPLLNDEFKFSNVHFHWGECDSDGSEHQINGASYSMEAHVVHYNSKYKKLNECFKHKDGLCVLVYFFLVTSDADLKSNPYTEEIVKHLKFIQNSHTSTNIPTNVLYWMREAIYCSKYYTYSGSYHIKTDPECVIWIVFPLIIPVTSYQVNEFRKLKNNNEKILNNCNKLNTINTIQVSAIYN